METVLSHPECSIMVTALLEYVDYTDYMQVVFTSQFGGFQFDFFSTPGRFFYFN